MESAKWDWNQSTQKKERGNAPNLIIMNEVPSKQTEINQTEITLLSLIFLSDKLKETQECIFKTNTANIIDVSHFYLVQYLLMLCLAEFLGYKVSFMDPGCHQIRTMVGNEQTSNVSFLKE